MKKSIETIWKEGFISNEALVVPRLTDLYNQKSQHIVDKFKTLGRRNLYGIIIGAFVILVGSFFAQVPLIGAFIFLILMWLVVVGRRQAKTLEKIDNSSSSYRYLKSFDEWLKASISEYGRIYRFVYPMLFLAFILGVFYSNLYENSAGESPITIIMNDPDTLIFYGIPVFWALGIVIFLGIVSYFSGLIYKFDLSTVYGRVFKKVDEILKDMEELRA
jgi:hypothetical protein